MRLISHHHIKTHLSSISPVLYIQTTTYTQKILKPHLTVSPIDPLNYLNSFIPQIKTLSKNPRNYDALTTLDTLLAQAHLFDSSTSLVVIDYLSQIKKLGRAKDVFLNLKSTGKVSDYFLFSLVFDCLVPCGKIEDVEILWNELCGSCLSIDVSDYVIYVCKYCGVGEIKKVVERVLMGGKVLKRQSYVALIGALCRENEGGLGKEVANVMHGLGLRVDDFSYYVLFRCFCRNGDVNEADVILRKLVKRKFHVDICIYGNFMYALCKMGKLREAKKLFVRLTKHEFVGGGYENLDSLKEGKRVIFQLKCEGNVPKILAYEAYFRSLCDVGRLDEAEVLLKKMMNSRTVPEICVYGSFIKALFEAERENDAIRFFQIEKKKGFIKVDEIASYVIVGLCQKGKVDKGVRIFHETATPGAFVNCSNVCNCILGSYWKDGRLEEAECLFRNMKDGNYGVPDISTFEIMISGYCDQCNVVKALHLFEEMLDSKIVATSALYEVIIKALCFSGRLREALKYLNDMVESGIMVSSTKWKFCFSSVFAALEHGVYDDV